MPLTRNEMIALTAGIAVGAFAGANVDKIKSAVAGLLGLVSDGVGESYAGVAQKVAEHVESIQDAVAESKAKPEVVTTS
jgi:xanthosine utilization system XapX-like protein